MLDLSSGAVEELQRLSPLDPDEHGDWEAVLDRANARCSRSVAWLRRQRDLGRPVRRSPRSLLAAAVVVAAVAAGPALAFSTPLRQFFGLEYPPVGPFTATVTSVTSVTTYRYALPKVKITFTIGTRGKPAGSGIPKGTAVLVYVSGKSGLGWNQTVVARGGDGRYSATTLAPPGGVAAVYVMGFVPSLRAPNGVYFSVPAVYPDRSSR